MQPSQCSECSCVVSTESCFSYSHIAWVDVVRKLCVCGHEGPCPAKVHVPQKIRYPRVELERPATSMPSARPAVMFGESYEPLRAHTPPRMAPTAFKRRKIGARMRKPRTVSLWDVVTMSDLDLDLSGAE